MEIQDMHIRFRAIAQQAGMQTVRAILPETIDIFLNAKIIDKVRQVVAENATTMFGDKVTIQRNPLSPINAIKTLYRSKQINVTSGDGSRTMPYKFILDFDDSVMYYTSIISYYENNKSFKCRLIEGDSLEDTMNDYCSKDDWNTPIAEIKHDDDKSMIVEVYTDKAINKPISIGVRYILLPNTVKFSDVINERVNCNLPEYLHDDIVMAAAREYQQSVLSTSHNPN